MVPLQEVDKTGPGRLLAIDVDGTLLRADGEIDPRDRRAVERARALGVSVTLATGRDAAFALPVARALDLDGPLICSDGIALVSGRTGACLALFAVALDAADRVLACFTESGLAPFVLLFDCAHGEESGHGLLRHLRSWVPELCLHASLSAAAGWRREGEIASLIGVGTEDRARAARGAAARALGGRVELSIFPLSDSGWWVVLARPAGYSKGDGLSRLAGRLGIARERVAAIGDAHNDLSMLAWAGRSFAMGHAPPEVRAGATETLVSTEVSGGGVAEALARWLGP